MLYVVKYSAMNISHEDKRKILKFARSINYDDFSKSTAVYITANKDDMKMVYVQTTDSSDVIKQMTDYEKDSSNTGINFFGKNYQVIAEIVSGRTFNGLSIERERYDFICIDGYTSEDNDLDTVILKTDSFGMNPEQIGIVDIPITDHAYTPEEIFTFATKVSQLYTKETLSQLFGLNGELSEIIKSFTFVEIKKTIESYEKEPKEISIGDFITTGREYGTFLVTYIHKQRVDGIDINSGMAKSFDLATIRKIDQSDIYLFGYTNFLSELLRQLDNIMA